MALNNEFKKILSLSAASMALLQGTAVVKGQSSEAASPQLADKPRGLQSKASALLLEPPHQKEILQLYADHSSHASHESHSSHYSGTTDSGGYDYSTPSTPTYTTPAAPPLPPPAPVTNQPVGPETTVPSVPTGTNAIGITNSVISTNTATNDATDIEALKKSAAQGSADAQMALGIDYRDGRHGLTKNIERAKMLFELSANQGNAYAKLLLDNLNQSDSQTNSAATN
jgi:TPR repeat protein